MKPSPQIRNGQMDDCRDLLTVYQTTRRLRMADATVEDVKTAHRGPLFRKWGWLVALQDGRAIAEIVFRTERSDAYGKLGIITSIDVDVRYQRRGIGSLLTKAAEEVLRSKGVSRVLVDSTPESYNFWMRQGYFSRGSLFELSADLRSLRRGGPRALSMTRLEDSERLPACLELHNLAPPGLLSKTAGAILGGRCRGEVFEFRYEGELVGAGAFAVENDDTASFVADAFNGGSAQLGFIACRTARAASTAGIRRVRTVVSRDLIPEYETLASWTVTPSSIMPAVKIL
ncbi:MAG: GNAT family N-acetyltransferase [Candidatus Thorarchaeota archaeon]|nr:GNAT family N-acetyltransferase [Candidatus Thorarchaeota archaeon]